MRASGRRVEAFGRLRRRGRARGGGRRAQDCATKRFSFSERSLTRTDELLLAMDQLEHTTALLVSDLEPTLPTSEEDLQRWLTENDMDKLWREWLEGWMTGRLANRSRDYAIARVAGRLDGWQIVAAI